MVGIRVAESKWPEVEAKLQNQAIAVLPIGASCKEHGRHLPMNTDDQQVNWLCGQLLQRLEVVIWPVVGYGYYPMFVEYPGSISLSEPVFIAVVNDILDGIERAGASRIVILNTGISTIAPITKMIVSRSRSDHLQLINVYEGERFGEQSSRLSEQAWGGHADEIETSLMLAIDPKSVDMHYAIAAPTEIVSGRFNRNRPDLSNYSPDGVNGDPSLASESKGNKLLVAMLDDVVQKFSD
ncbi:MAG: creatinine amidohydrolase [Gammaproteobacteria bacterium]|jgi:creatinine amidohydrolase